MGPIELFDAAVDGGMDYTATAGSDLVIITSGSPGKPGMTREDLLQTNANIVGSVTENVVKNSPDCILMMLTNPLDIMTYTRGRSQGFHHIALSDKQVCWIQHGSLFHLARTRRVCRRHPGTRPRRTWRYDGPAPTLYYRQRYPDSAAHTGRSH